MKSIAIILSVVIALSLAACSGTPRETYADLQEGYIAAVQPVVDLRAAHQIDDRTYTVEIMPLIRTGNTALNDIDTITQSGGDPSQFREVVRTVTRGLLQYYVDHQSR